MAETTAGAEGGQETSDTASRVAETTVAVVRLQAFVRGVMTRRTVETRRLCEVVQGGMTTGSVGMVLGLAYGLKWECVRVWWDEEDIDTFVKIAGGANVESAEPRRLVAWMESRPLTEGYGETEARRVSHVEWREAVEEALEGDGFDTRAELRRWRREKIAGEEGVEGSEEDEVYEGRSGMKNEKGEVRKEGKEKREEGEAERRWRRAMDKWKEEGGETR